MESDPTLGRPTSYGILLYYADYDIGPRISYFNSFLPTYDVSVKDIEFGDLIQVNELFNKIEFVR